MESLNLWSYIIMNKKKKNTQSPEMAKTQQANSSEKEVSEAIYTKNWFLALLIFIASFGMYTNSISNDYALDDIMVYTGNQLVQSGMDGMSELWSKDFLYGYRGFQSLDLAGSRWRPLSLISFAIDVELWGNNPHWSHFMNVLLFAICCVLLFYFLGTQLFPKNILGAFFAVLIFAALPIHTEVVANIKSRDEILCFFFLIIGLISIFKWNNIKGKLLFVVCIFLSLLAKENAVPLLAGLPLLLYYFKDQNYKKIAFETGLLLAVIGFYLFLRLQIIPMGKLEASKEILNNPFMHASAMQAFATKVYLLAYSIVIILIPFKLSHDYSFQHFAYLDLSSTWFIISFIILSSISIWSLLKLKKKNLYALGWGIFIILYSISTNFVIEIGTPLAERLLFLPSIALCFIIIAINKHMDETKFQKPFQVILFVVFGIYGLLTFQRNQDWKNDDTLSLADYPKCPKSIRLANRVATAYINMSADSSLSASKKKELLNRSIEICKKALAVHPNYNDMLSNIGVAYSRMDSIDICESYWKNFERVDPGNPKLVELHHFLFVRMYNKGLMYGSIKPDSAYYWFNRALPYAKAEADANFWYDYAGANYMLGHFKEAADGFAKTLKLNPAKKEAEMGLMAASQKAGIPLK